MVLVSIIANGDKERITIKRLFVLSLFLIAALIHAQERELTLVVVQPTLQTITEDSATKPFNSVSAFGAWLSRKPDNTTRTPYNVKLNVSNLSGIKDVLLNAPQKYVYLDLSGSIVTTIPENDLTSFCITFRNVITVSVLFHSELL
jgi:hypothetical protein